MSVALVLLATVAFAGIGLVLAGLLRAEVNLAAANGLYLVLLLLGGMIVPAGQAAPGPGRRWPGRCRPAALSDGLHAPGHRRGGAGAQSWVVLAVWAVAAPAGRRADVPLGVSGPERPGRRPRPGPDRPGPDDRLSGRSAVLAQASSWATVIGPRWMWTIWPPAVMATASGSPVK